MAILALVSIWHAPLPFPEEARHALAIAVFMVILWITEAVPNFAAGLVGCWLFWALGVVPSRTAFSGFSSEAPWFLIGALYLGLMVTETGLARRLAFAILSSVGVRYSRILLGLILTSFLMTFLIPSGPPRVILLGTIALGIAASFGLDAKSNVARGLILAITFAATQFDRTIIGSTPIILARSLIQEHGQVTVYWTQWFAAFFPFNLFNVILMWILITRWYPPEKTELAGGREYLRHERAALGPWTSREIRAAVLTILVVGFWATDFLHHISPAVIGFGAGLAASLPAFGILRAEDSRKISYSTFLFMGTAIAMGDALRETGALEILSSGLFRFMASHMDNLFHSTAMLYWGAFATHLILPSSTAMIATSMPLIMSFAVQNQLNPLELGMLWSFGTGGKLFVYQSLVMITGYSFGAFTGRDVFRMGLTFAIAEFLLLLGVVSLYWPLIGIR
ncbi:MAG TPA: SLC13 family permease [Terriglobia bacterium]|nr:SLC13 family permease [Terriglobia bacterium]